MKRVARRGKLSRQQREELVEKCVPLIKRLALQLALQLPLHVASDELIVAGVVGLIKALNKFDPAENFPFETYAESKIHEAMLDVLRSLKSIPLSIKLKARRFEQAYLKLEKIKGAPVKDQDLAEELGFSLEQYYDFLGQMRGLRLLEQISFDLSRFEEFKKVLVEAMDRLSYQEKTVISLHYYEQLTLPEIINVMQLTEPTVYRLYTSAILKLRAILRTYLNPDIIVITIRQQAGHA